MRPVAPSFMNLYVNCPIFTAKHDEDAKNHLLASTDWMRSQGITEEAEGGRNCLTLGGDAHLCSNLNPIYVTSSYKQEDHIVLGIKLWNNQVNRLAEVMEE